MTGAASARRSTGLPGVAEEKVLFSLMHGLPLVLQPIGTLNFHLPGCRITYTRDSEVTSRPCWRHPRPYMGGRPRIRCLVVGNHDATTTKTRDKEIVYLPPKISIPIAPTTAQPVKRNRRSQKLKNVKNKDYQAVAMNSCRPPPYPKGRALSSPYPRDR